MGKARRRERKLLLWTSLLLLAVCLATGDAADLRTDQGTRKNLKVLNNEIGGHFLAVDGGREEGFHARRLQQQNSVEITEGPLQNSFVQDQNITISFLVSGFSIDTKCQLLLENTILRFWHICKSPYNLKKALTRDGRYKFMVEADTGGDSDADAMVTWTLDRVPPSAEFKGPLPKNHTTRSVAQIQFETNDHLSGVRSVECQLDSGTWEMCESGVIFQGLSPGEHSVRIRSTDRAGNVQTTPTVHTWVVASPDSSQRVVPLAGKDISVAGSIAIPAAEHYQEPEPTADHDHKQSFWEKTRNVLGDGAEAARDNLLITIIVLVGISTLTVLCCGLCIHWKRHSSHRRGRLESVRTGASGTHVVNPLSEFDIGNREVSLVLQAALPNGLRRFTYKELLDATGGFPDTQILGAGGFGKVYMGKLQDDTLVAIKRLDKGGQQGDREFYIEVSTLSTMNHPNIVRCLGACVEAGNRCCVFHLMHKGNSRDVLDSRDKFFNWQTRLRALVGVARGLAYMHEASDPAIVHGDFKTENILLDKAGHARISDFGLCTRVPRNANPRLGRGGVTDSGRMVPTFGYIAPEYATGNVTTKSDVYSLGVVMLEILTGRKPVDTNRPRAEQNLVKWVLKNADKLETIKGLVDPMIRYEVTEVQVAEFTEKAASCLETSPSRRPSAAQLAVSLERLLALQTPKHQSDVRVNRKHIIVMADSKSYPPETFIPTTVGNDSSEDLPNPPGTNEQGDLSPCMETKPSEEWKDGDAEAGPSQRRLLRPVNGPPALIRADMERWEARVNWDDLEKISSKNK